MPLVGIDGFPAVRQALAVVRLGGQFTGPVSSGPIRLDEAPTADPGAAAHPVRFTPGDTFGLGSHPDVLRTARAALERHGPVAPAHDLTSRLADSLAALHGPGARVAVAAHADGAHAAALAFVLGPDDLVVCDEHTHPSLVAGARWANCRRAVVRSDDRRGLDRLLAEQDPSLGRTLVMVERGPAATPAAHERLRRRVEGVRRPGVAVLVHLGGALPLDGVGALADAVDLWAGRFDGDLGCAGGYLAGRADAVEALIRYVPGLAATEAPSAVVAAAALTSLHWLRRDPGLRDRLRRNVNHLVERLHRLDPGHRAPSLVVGGGRVVPLTATLYHGFARSLAAGLAGKGFEVTLEQGEQRPQSGWVTTPGARLVAHVRADHSRSDLDGLVRALRDALTSIAGRR